MLAQSEKSAILMIESDEHRQFKKQIIFRVLSRKCKKKIIFFTLFLFGRQSTSHTDQYILTLENSKSDLFFKSRP